MRNVFLVAVLATALAASLPTSTSAFDAEWVVQLRATDPYGGSYGPYGTYGTGDMTPARHAPWDIPPTLVWICCPDLGTDEPHWIRDVRSAQPAEVAMTWHLRIHAGPTYASTKFRFSAWNPLGATPSPRYDIGPSPGFVVALYRGASREYVFDPSQNGTVRAPQWTKEYDISAGQVLTDFRLVREPIPEPASAVALVSGLACTIFVKRRRIAP